MWSLRYMHATFMTFPTEQYVFTDPRFPLVGNDGGHLPTIQKIGSTPKSSFTNFHALFNYFVQSVPLPVDR